MVNINWQIFAQILTAIIALAAFSLSLYLVLRTKPSLKVEKISAKKNRDSFIEFRFFLDNDGERPTTIKSIDFHTDENFMPKNKLLITNEKTSPTTGETILMLRGVEGFKLPYHLMPYTSLKLKAQLDFSNKHDRDKAIKEGKGEGQIHFNIIIKHSKGVFKDRI